MPEPELTPAPPGGVTALGNGESLFTRRFLDDIHPSMIEKHEGGFTLYPSRRLAATFEFVRWEDAEQTVMRCKLICGGWTPELLGVTTNPT